MKWIIYFQKQNLMFLTFLRWIQNKKQNIIHKTKENKEVQLDLIKIVKLCLNKKRKNIENNKIEKQT